MMYCGAKNKKTAHYSLLVRRIVALFLSLSVGRTDGSLSPLVSDKAEWGYNTRRHMLEPVRPEAVLPDRALCLPTLSHFLIVNKTSLSHTQTHTHTHTHTHTS
jgi:hypothetical protein